MCLPLSLKKSEILYKYVAEVLNKTKLQAKELVFLFVVTHNNVLQYKKKKTAEVTVIVLVSL